MPRPRAPRKLVLSPTRIRIFRECAAQYRLEYVDRLGRLYHRPRAGFSFGSSLHRALETFHASGGASAVTAEELGESLERAWVPQGYQSKEQEAQWKEEALRIVDAYHAAAAQRAAAPDASPEPVLLYAEKTLRMDIAPGIALSGRVDRVDEHADGSLEIVDYKSGRLEVLPEDVAGSPALGIYQLLLKHLHPDRRVFATLTALRTGASASHEQGDDERAELLAECVEIGETLRDRDWESVTPAPCDHCPHCDFLPYCQRYWRAHGEG